MLAENPTGDVYPSTSNPQATAEPASNQVAKFYGVAKRKGKAVEYPKSKHMAERMTEAELAEGMTEGDKELDEFWETVEGMTAEIDAANEGNESSDSE